MKYFTAIFCLLATIYAPQAIFALDADTTLLMSCSNSTKTIQVTITQLANGRKDSRVQTEFIGILNGITSDETVDGVRTLQRIELDSKGKELAIFSLKVHADSSADLLVAAPMGHDITAKLTCTTSPISE